MQIQKHELIVAYAQSIGIETARELIDKKIADSALENKEIYTGEEVARICGELANEGGVDPNSRTASAGSMSLDFTVTVHSDAKILLMGQM